MHDPSRMSGECHIARRGPLWDANGNGDLGVFLLKIDFAMLRTRLARDEQRPMTNGDVMTWLLERGFQITRGAWVAPEERLRMLQIREIIFSHPINDAPTP